MTTAAGILSSEATTLTFGDGERLACLYVVVDARSDHSVADFLATWHRCCDTVELDWQAVRRPRSALVGLELSHTCGLADRLRLVFDIQRDADALQHLANTEALVVGTRPYGSFANRVGAYGVDGNAVRETVKAARRGLNQLTAVGS